MEQNEKLNEAMQAFIKKYQPANSPADSDEELSTSEIQNKLTEMIDKASLDEIYDFMKASGFDFQFIGGGLKWLLKIA